MTTAAPTRSTLPSAGLARRGGPCIDPDALGRPARPQRPRVATLVLTIRGEPSEVARVWASVCNEDVVVEARAG